MGVHILAIGTALPEVSITAPGFDDVLARLAAPSTAVEKTQHINARTKIHTRRFVQIITSPLLSGSNPPTIDAVNDVFMRLGVKMAVEAARTAIADWAGAAGDITHLLSTTCTSNAYPGFDHFVARALKLSPSTQKTLISGVGCSGGLAILRLANVIARNDPAARVLCVACEVNSSLLRTEIAHMDATGLPNIPVVLFADGASALIVGSSPRPHERPSFEVLKTHVETLPNSEAELSYNVHPTGWRATVTPKVPLIVASALPPLVRAFLPRRNTAPATYDWFIHPGGAAILAAVEKGLGLNAADHMLASWEVYENRGNMSSASIGHVIEAGRRLNGREDVVAVAFGPGINVEIVLLRRTPRRRTASQNALPVVAARGLRRLLRLAASDIF